MRVLISYGVDVTDEFRAAIRRYYAKDGLADREEIKDWFRMYGDSMNEDLAAYYSADTNDSSYNED